MAPTSEFVGHTPNMLPSSAANISASEASPFPLFYPQNAQNLSTQHPLSSYTSYSALSFQFLDQFTCTSPSAMIAAGASSTVSGHDRVDLEAIFPSLGAHDYDDTTHNSPSCFSPESPSQPGQKRSRLPSNDVGRKAPRKSVASSSSQYSTSQPSKGKPARPRGSSPKRNSQQRQHCLPQAQHKPPKKNGLGTRYRQPTPATIKRSPKVAPQSMAPSPSRQRKIILDDEDEYEENNQEASLEAPIRNDATIYPKLVSRSTDSTDPARRSPQLCSHDRRLRNELPLPGELKHFYPTPEGMKAIRQALGDGNWTECLALVEEYCLDEITEEQLSTATKPIFGTDEQTRNRILREMISKVVLPVVDAQAVNERERASPYWPRIQKEQW